MQREIKEFTTKSGKKFTIKTYLSGREMNELKKDMYGAIKVDLTRASEGANAIKDLPATFMIDRERKLIEVSVTSFDGSVEGIVDRLQDLPDAEYQDALKQISEQVQPDFQTSK